MEKFCRNFVDLILDAKLASIHRIVWSEFSSNPSITKSFFLERPAKTYKILSKFISQGQSNQVIQAKTHPDVLADQIISILKERYYLEFLFGLRKTILKQEKESLLEDSLTAIKLIMALN